MLPNQAIFKPEPCLDHVVNRVRFGAFILLKVVMALPMSRPLRIVGLNIAKHDLRSFLTDHVPHRPHLLSAQIKADV